VLLLLFQHVAPAYPRCRCSQEREKDAETLLRDVIVVALPSEDPNDFSNNLRLCVRLSDTNKTGGIDATSEAKHE
jgi:hypothetical protein